MSESIEAKKEEPKACEQPLQDTGPTIRQLLIKDLIEPYRLAIYDISVSYDLDVVTVLLNSDRAPVGILIALQDMLEVFGYMGPDFYGHLSGKDKKEHPAFEFWFPSPEQLERHRMKEF